MAISPITKEHMHALQFLAQRVVQAVKPGSRGNAGAPEAGVSPDLAAIIADEEVNVADRADPDGDQAVFVVDASINNNNALPDDGKHVPITRNVRVDGKAVDFRPPPSRDYVPAMRELLLKAVTGRLPIDSRLRKPCNAADLMEELTPEDKADLSEMVARFTPNHFKKPSPEALAHYRDTLLIPFRAYKLTEEYKQAVLRGNLLNGGLAASSDF